MSHDISEPKYLVIGFYPNSPYSEGQIVYPLSGDTANGFSIPDLPNLFRKCDWWEFVDLSDLPQYLKSDKSNNVYKVSSYNMNVIPAMPFAISEEGSTLWLKFMKPSTLSEYNTYLASEAAIKNFYHP